jgi:hypothetical protein
MCPRLRITHLWFWTLLFSLSVSPATAEETVRKSVAPEAEPLVVVEAFMCESIQDLQARNKAVVFPYGIARVYCLTTLERIKERTFVYHNWYYRDELSTRIRLALRPPRWSVYSTIQLRESDIGPWRVEVADPDGRVLHTLRFSVTN